MNILVICAVQGSRAKKALEIISMFDGWDCTIKVHTPRKRSTLECIREFLDTADTRTPALIMYLGDGTRSGWKVTPDEEVLYSDLVRLFMEYSPTRRISVVNDTNYGHMLIKELIGARDPLYTSCMCNSRFDCVNAGEIFSLALECWNQGLRPEQKISALSYGHLGAHHNVAIWQRWGEFFEDILMHQSRQEVA